MVLPKVKKDVLIYPQLMTESGTFAPMVYNKVKWIDISHSEGKLLAQHVVPYPPGVPILFKGEKSPQI